MSDVERMTMAEYIQMQADKRQHVEYVEPIGELQKALDAKNELYRHLYQCQMELRETQRQLKYYKERYEYLTKNLLVLPPEGTETSSAETTQSDTLRGDSRD